MLPGETRHRRVKYLNNVIDADHGKLKQLIGPVCGVKLSETAYATTRGFEVMRALRKRTSGAMAIWRREHRKGEPGPATDRDLHLLNRARAPSSCVPQLD